LIITSIDFSLSKEHKDNDYEQEKEEEEVFNDSSSFIALFAER